MLNRNSLLAGRFALTGVALATMLLTSVDAMALGLGRLNVQSGLGETLRAEIDVSSLTADEASNLQVKVASPEAYRAAGVDYNAVLPGTKVTLERRADGRPYLRVISDRSVQEPFVDVILELSWSTGRLVREYTMLFDPPSRMAAAPAPAPSTSPNITPARPESPATPPRAERRPVAPPKPAPEASAPAEPRRAAAPTPRAAAADDASGDEYKVRPGDTLSRIAGRTQRSGVSLDQMLVALYQANPDAFLGNNMNRLKSGAVLSVPSADAARAVSPSEARQLILAQSADFGAYRQRLAGGVPAARVEGSSRQATGQVKAEVDDRKKNAASEPDKLTLSKGASAKASAPEARLSKEREQKENAARVAELARNVEDLKKLSGTPAGSGKPAGPATTASGPAVTAPVATPTVPTPQTKSAPAQAASAPVPAAAPASAAAPAPAPAVATARDAASAPKAASTPVAAAASAADVPASSPVVAAAEPVSAAPAPAPAATATAEGESSILDNSLALALGAALLAVLAGFGIYRFTRRKKKDSGETSFLESRLQPDSFFGASGGQRIDTRDASGASSSMSYSLSQLDAIGDVDPVAEADVYLAYGRDLQAEEILKEAMRASPERLAIRTKLLEVYAKRRDTKGFELLATQLYGLTGGQGDDWAKAQELGQQIEPDNPLYQPGGAPAQTAGDGGRASSEPLGASTMPHSVMPSPAEFGSSTGGPSSGFDSTGSGVDLDLDLGAFDGSPSVAEAPPARLNEQTQPFPAAQPEELGDMHLDLDALSASPAPSPAPAAPVSNSGPMEFDLSSISLDLGDGAPVDEVTLPATPKPKPETPDLADIDLGDAGGNDADPIARKLELAEEFRQIGDMEGARDLLQEVVTKATGSVKTRAQAMLDELG